MNQMTQLKGAKVLVALTAILACGAWTGVSAQEASELDSSEASGYLGKWNISMEFGDMTLTFSDVDGKLLAILESDQMTEPQEITDITKSDDGLELKFDSDFGELVITAAVEGNELTGTLGDTAGQFNVEITGVNPDLERVEAAEEEENPERAAAIRRRRFRSGGSTKTTIGGKPVSITYGNLFTAGPDFETLEGNHEDGIVPFTTTSAIKLRTEANIKIGGLVLKTENVAANYPGVYSLWLKRDGDDWKLIANEKPDVWGTQHDSSADVGAIALTHGTRDFEMSDDPLDLADFDALQKADKLSIKLEGEDEGTLKLTWGAHEWTAKFSAAD